jgi:ubiquinone/menaquinone biosynthesis C-methylase UbiE
VTSAKAYTALADVYDRWTADNDYARWAQAVERLVNRPRRAHRVLDLCCGTGTMTDHLRRAGHDVVGIDASSAMLARARAKLDDHVTLVQATAPDLPDLGPFDAAVCCFDSVNYLGGAEDLEQTFAAVAAMVRPGGAFVFDVNTRRKLVEVFGNSHYGDDLDDFAYVWRNRLDPEAGTVRFLITIFRREGEQFTRHEETHTQTILSAERIERAADAAGLAVEAVLDDYSDRPAGPETLRQTWVLRRRSA